MPRIARRYAVILYWSEEDDTFIAEVTELPGCAADRETQEQVLENAKVAVQEWIETARDLGRTIPEPRGPAELRLSGETEELNTAIGGHSSPRNRTIRNTIPFGVLATIAARG